MSHKHELKGKHEANSNSWVQHYEKHPNFIMWKHTIQCLHCRKKKNHRKLYVDNPDPNHIHMWFEIRLKPDCMECVSVRSCFTLFCVIGMQLYVIRTMFLITAKILQMAVLSHAPHVFSAAPRYDMSRGEMASFPLSFYTDSQSFYEKAWCLYSYYSNQCKYTRYRLHCMNEPIWLHQRNGGQSVVKIRI